MENRQGYFMTREELEGIVYALAAGIGAVDAVVKQFDGTAAYKETLGKLEKQHDLVMKVLGVR